MTANTLFLRLEGPLQAWGDTSKFVIRRTMEAPTKSGILGVICCAMGLSREAAREMLPELNSLAVGVRIDRPGTRWWDWHTVGAGIGILRADGKGPKRTASTGEFETLITRREYLADASFLVALRGDPDVIARVASALHAPAWPVFLGRKSCPPVTPVVVLRRDGGAVAPLLENHEDLRSALTSNSVPWRARCEGDPPPNGNVTNGTTTLECLMEWPAGNDRIAPAEAEVWYDVPASFDPPVHQPRFVLRERAQVPVGEPQQLRMPPPPRPRADYRDPEYRKRRAARLQADHALCVFCKCAATTVQHVTYRHAGGDEHQDDLRALCRLCHDAITMVEYGRGMGLDRIDPCDPRWRDEILRTRAEILAFRSEEGRRRALRDAPETLRRELLEEEAS